MGMLDFVGDSPLAWIALAGGLAVPVAGILFAYSRWRRPHRAQSASKTPGMVYLYQFRRPIPAFGPNMSPFCIKLETYLRMAKIPYESRPSNGGPLGKCPYIEVDGEIVPDSNFCISFLQKHFGVQMDEHFSEEQRAIGHAVLRMVEESTYWTGVHRRWIETPEAIPESLTETPSLFMRLLLRVMRRKVAHQLHAQGTGRHSVEKINEIAESDLRALSNILGGNLYFLGEKPSSVDAAVFGLLSVFLWQLPGSVQETLMKTDMVNLQVYCLRMRRLYWKDWEQLKVKKHAKPT